MPTAVECIYDNERIDVDTALAIKATKRAKRTDDLFACIQCRAPVWPFKKGGHTTAHFEHNRRNPHCPLSHRLPGRNKTRISRADVEQFLASLRYERDCREPPDLRRRGQFQAGWNAKRVYQEKTLRDLTWHNMGFRFGQHFGSRPEHEIISVYEIVTSFHNGSKNGWNFPEEESSDGRFVEGAVTRIAVNAYERNSIARRKCLEIHGDSCCICGLNFGQTYGLIAEGYIHVHHLRPLSEISERYEVDPKNDLRPVCPNCHAVLHLRRPPFSIDELAALVESKKNSG